MDDKNLYINENVDENKLPFDSDFFMKESDSEEDKVMVRKTRAEHGVTEDDIKKEITKINNNSEYHYSDDDMPMDSSSTTTVTRSEIVDANNEKAIRKILDNQNNQIIAKGQNIYNTQIVKYQANEQAKIDIAYNEQDKFRILENQGQMLLNQINNEVTRLWKYKKLYCYRSGQNNEVYKGNKKEVSEVIEGFLGKPLKIVSIKDILKANIIDNNKIEQYIFSHQVPVIEGEIFEPKEKEFFNKNGVLYKNLFLYTDYLKQRFIDPEEHQTGNYDCFIIDFFENIVDEANQDDSQKPMTRAILNFLAYFFQKMENTNVALVLNGNKEISEGVFWKKLIKPIFGNEEYCITIDDKMLSKPISEIVENKIFFNIGDFTPTEDNKNKINQLLQGILVDKYVLTDSSLPKKIPVYGQVLITANETISYMNKYYSLFVSIPLI
jgi:hypothetical protein